MGCTRSRENAPWQSERTSTRSPLATTKRITAEVYEGHSDCAVIVSFDPAVVWGSATSARPIGYGKHVGHAVLGTIDDEPFES